MQSDADIARELERLRTELMDFVVDAMAERMASGAEPELGDKLVAAIDRRVGQAVDAKVAETRWPDPDRFAASVAAALARNAPAERPRRSADDEEVEAPRGRRDTASLRGRATPVEERKPNLLQYAAIALVGLLVVAAMVYFGMRLLNPAAQDVPMVQEPQVITQPVDPVNRTLPPANDAASNVTAPAEAPAGR